jgi:hypothetical protein
MITDLIRHKHHFWCRHCERGPFFPVACIEHADTVTVEADVDVEEEDVVDVDDGILM